MKKLLLIFLIPFVIKAQGLTGVLGLLDEPKTTFYVSNFLEMQNAIAYAKDGSVIYIQNDIEFLDAYADTNNYGNVITINNDITIMGLSSTNKPILSNDSSGAEFNFFQVVDANVTFKNLEIKGFEYDPDVDGNGQSLRIGIMSGNWSSNSTSNVVVDSCVINGMSYAGLYARYGGNLEVKNDTIKNCNLYGLGYGIKVDRNSYAEIYNCVLDSNRHSIASDGWVDVNGGSSYDAYNNDFYTGTNTHLVDVHGKYSNSGIDSTDAYYQYAGGAFNIYNNTFHDATFYGIGIRGVPYDSCKIYNNTFAHSWLIGRNDGTNSFQQALRQYPYNEDSTNAWGNIQFYNNNYGSVKPPYFYGRFGKFFSVQYDSGWVNLQTVSDSLTTSTDSIVIGSQIIFGDFNGDNITDIISSYNGACDSQLIAGSSHWTVGVDQDSSGHLFVSWSGLSKWKVLNDSNYAISSLDVADIDNDGKSDLIYNESTYSSGGVGEWTALPEAFNTYTLYTKRDFNGDGVDDSYKIYKYGETYTYDSLYASDFSSGYENWGGQNITRAGNIDSILDSNDVLRGYANATTGSHYFYRTWENTDNGDTVAIEFDYYIPSGNTTVKGMQLGANSISSTITGTRYYYNLNGSWKHAFIILITDGTDDFRIYMLDASNNSSIAGENLITDDLMYIKNFKFRKVHTIL